MKIIKKYNSNFRSYTILNNQDIFLNINNRISNDQNGATVIVPHVCNNINAFGAGFAGQVADLYAEVKINFHMLGNKAKLGHSQYITLSETSKKKNKVIFVNMIAQNRLISENNPRPLNYGALVYCMNDVRLFIKNLLKQNDSHNIEIHAPKFGSGLAGGNWNFISDLIEDIWFDQKVFIYNSKGKLSK